MHAYALLDKLSGKVSLFDPGQGCTVEEPIFVPMSKNAPEGGDWVLGMIQRMDMNRSDLVVLDTKDFAKPVAVVQLPFRTDGQIHGNWVNALPDDQSLTRVSEPVKKLMGRGALEMG
ncbi:retinal pigment epithelial membrane protein-domain-containing protein [Triangularia setosa]|uniref:Retinal pigment epithelial membrane protein-domain-containing protein n=1 Tax=Triangularia setosa TaxID=2587417 RepID=A0AAN6VWJ3_9PEZI|nr:retinal pigment epithelial membrane protein-domain-containing protein [Podospora setosa]